MAIFTIGSINADFFYYVDRLPTPGETLGARDYTRGLGGKGANQSIAAALAGSDVTHIGAVGEDGAWAVEVMERRQVRSDRIVTSSSATGNATIIVDQDAENVIVLHPGANASLGQEQLEALRSDASEGDILLLQNEVNISAEAAALGRELGMQVLYSAAPFDVDAVQAVLSSVDILLLNEIEYAQLQDGIGSVDVPHILVTRGGDGADLISEDGTMHVPARSVDPIDTTGAGDCFAGYFAAGLDQGLGLASAMKLASAAAALKVTRRGTSDAFPARAEVDRF